LVFTDKIKMPLGDALLMSGPGVVILAGADALPLKLPAPKNIIKKWGTLEPRFFIGKEGTMPREFNPLADIASILGSVAKVLPPLPAPPPFPLPQPPEVPKPRTAESSSSPSVGYVDVNDGLIKASTEKFRAEQKEKGLVPFYYE
jgi:hypothetical protein